MSYLHCHTKNCNWSQDDFWSWKYNPILWFLKLFIGRCCYIIPRIIYFDKCVMHDFKWKKQNRFSWWLIGWEFKRMIKIIYNMKWWTYKQWEKLKILPYVQNADCIILI
jgi:hypothetical protein